MLKKMMAAVLAGVMALALAVPAFADNTEPDNTQPTAITSATEEKEISMKFNGKSEVPAMNITFEGSGYIVMNPYKVNYITSASVVGSDTDADLTTGTDQIISSVLTIKSKTKVPVQINAKVVTKIEGNVTLGTASYADNTKETKNMAFVYLAFAEDTDKLKNVDLKEKTNPHFVILKAGTTGVTQNNIYVIPQSPDGATEKSCVMKFMGDMVANPTKSWTDGDRITPTVTLTLKPNGQTAGSGT